MASQAALIGSDPLDPTKGTTIIGAINNFEGEKRTTIVVNKVFTKTSTETLLQNFNLLKGTNWNRVTFGIQSHNTGDSGGYGYQVNIERIDNTSRRMNCNWLTYDETWQGGSAVNMAIFVNPVTGDVTYAMSATSHDVNNKYRCTNVVIYHN